MGMVCGRRVFEKKKGFFWRRVVYFWRDAALRRQMVLYSQSPCMPYTHQERSCNMYVLGICISVCAFGPGAREEVFMQVQYKVVSIAACVFGLGPRAVIFSPTGQIQLSVMNREKACVQANNASIFGEIEREYL